MGRAQGKIAALSGQIGARDHFDDVLGARRGTGTERSGRFDERPPESFAQIAAAVREAVVIGERFEDPPAGSLAGTLNELLGAKTRERWDDGALARLLKDGLGTSFSRSERRAWREQLARTAAISKDERPERFSAQDVGEHLNRAALGAAAAVLARRTLTAPRARCEALLGTERCAALLDEVAARALPEGWFERLDAEQWEHAWRWALRAVGPLYETSHPDEAPDAERIRAGFCEGVRQLALYETPLP